MSAIKKLAVYFVFFTPLLMGLFVISTATSVFADVSNAGSGSDAVIARRVQLQNQLDSLEKEIDQQQTILNQKKSERVSLERDVAILNASIKEAQLSIKARNIEIARLAEDIGQKKQTIGVLSNKIQTEKDQVAELMRKANEIDSYSLVEMLLTGRSMTQFFSDLDQYQSIRQALRLSYANLADDKKQTEQEKANLEDKSNEQNQLLTIQKLQQKRLEQQQNEKNKILGLTKGIESAYQKILHDKELSAAAIRTELFTLQGSASIPFEKALQYALDANKATGIRPAFLLAIIAEESNLGQNIGTGSWTIDMKNPRDTVPFADICRRLGLNPDSMPVSKKPWYGWGGAMGPAQIIPSTWVQLESRIAQASGVQTPNPWNPRDAFVAASILLTDNGAVGNQSAERLAALRYFAGWTNASKRAYAFYGDDVMNLADKYQRQIDILRGS